MTTTAADAARLEVADLRRAFGGVQALAGASLSDRILTLYRGRITAELGRHQATEDSVGQHILGG